MYKMIRSIFRKRGALLIPGLVFVAVLSAQDLPMQMTLDLDSNRLRLGGVPSEGFYEENMVRNLYMDFEDPDYWQYMHDNFGTDNYALATLRYEGEIYDSVGVAFKGQTSYKKPKELGSEKLSFSVKLDEFIEGQDINGYNNFNFNNAFQDPSFMREILYTHLSREFVPALKGNFIRLWLNGEDWGLYPNVQQLNGDFIKEWFPDKNGIRWRADVPADAEGPAPERLIQQLENAVEANWGDGTAALNYHGDDTLAYQQYYTLKDTDLKDPWNYLVQVCKVLNETPLNYLRDSLKHYMDLDATLWFLAQEIIFSDDDSYVHKGKMDYYLYMEEATGRMLPLEFDGNSAMSMRNSGWSPFLNEENPNYPLLNRLLAIPELRQRYIAHVQTILDRIFDPLLFNPIIDSYDSQIRDHVLSDPKTIVKPFQYDRGVRALRSFMTNRKDSILSCTEFSRVSPTIEQVHRWVEGSLETEPENGKEVRITTLASHPDGIAEVRLYYGTGLRGTFESLVMENEGDSSFGATVPAFAAGTRVRYYIEAIAADSAKSASYRPEGAAYDVYVYEVVAVNSEVDGLVINELMASNDLSMADGAGEYDDWVEIHNSSSLEIKLEGFLLSDEAREIHKWVFPDTSIGAGEYMVIWADEDEEQGPLHASFKLSASGEEVLLSDTSGNIIDHVVFPEQQTDISMGRWPDATGPFYSMNPTFRAANLLTSLDDSPITGAFRVYPNPCRNILHISTPENQEGEICIYNLWGQKVIQLPFTDNINVDVLSEGMYLIRCGSQSRLFRKLSRN